MVGKTLLFIGSLNRSGDLGIAEGEGLSVFLFDEANGAAKPLGVFRGIDNPSFLAIDAARHRLYAVSEVYGWNEGTVTAFRFDPGDGRLRYLNKQPTLGSMTNHVSLDRTGNHVFAVNYAHEPRWGGYYREEGPGQAVAVFPVAHDGRLGPASASVAHRGSGADPVRQNEPHPHCAIASPDNRFVLVADLGIDQVISYRFDGGRLIRSSCFAMPAGSGPRHLKFAPDDRSVYVVNELASTVAHLGYDTASGELSLLQVVSTLPVGFSGWNNGSELQIAPDGRFLYAANRGHDSVAVFGIDRQNGALQAIGHHPAGGAIPRHICLTPSGSHLLVCNQQSGGVAVLQRDAETGALAQTGVIEIGTPMVAGMVLV